MQDLYRSCKNKLDFKDDVTIVVLNSKKNSLNPLGKTAFYDPSSHKVGLYTKGRHIKDVLRSLAHELVHHSQNCRGVFAGGLPTVQGYAQEDGHLRDMEREAYEKGNMLFRDWEDGLKSGDTLFTEKSTGERLMEEKEKKESVENDTTQKNEVQKFLPPGYEINHKAYKRLNDTLTKRWGFEKKEK